MASFGEAVAGELAGTGVTLTTVLPGFTRTEFHERAGIGGRKIPGPAWMSAEDVAAEALDGRRAPGRPWLVPGVLNKLRWPSAAPVPRAARSAGVAARLAPADVT